MPLLLDEILKTRIMVKDSMKKSNDKATKRMLDHRQLGLKLIANVTYGYTSASFSGRMPLVEVCFHTCTCRRCEVKLPFILQSA